MASDYVANDPVAYDRQMGRWSQRLAVSFIDFAAFGEAANIVDVGCGTGSLALALCDAVPQGRITGIDVSAAFVAYAQSRSRDARLSFEQGDAMALPYPDGNFDAALSLLVLNFLPDAGRAVREMYRVTRPGGVVAATVWDFRGGLTFMRVLADTAATLDPEANAFRAKLFSGPLTGPGELAATWAEVGLLDVAQASLTIRMEFESFADYWQPWLAGQGTVGAYVASRSEGMRQLIERHLRLAYLAGGDDGPRSFAATAWAVRGIR